MRRIVLLGFIFLALLMSGLALLAYQQISEANHGITNIIELNNKKSSLYYKLRYLARERTIYLHRMLNEKDPFTLDEYKIKHSELASLFIATRETLESLPLSNKEQSLMSEFMATLQISQPLQTELAESALEGKAHDVMGLIEQAVASQDLSLSRLDKLVTHQEIQNRVNLDNARLAYQKTVHYLVLIAASILLFGAIISYFTLRRVTLSARAMLAANRDLQATNYELDESRVAAESANIAKSDFLANMSHEIRTPMNAILGVISILRSGKGGNLDKAGKEMIDIAYRNADHLLALINDLLSFTGVDAGKIPFKNEPVDVRNELKSVIESLQDTANKKGIILNYHIPPEISKFIMLDPIRLYQLLMNLINNAIKYTEQGHVDIYVNRIYDNNLSYIRFDIQDTGIGINEKDQKIIFDKFFQVDSSSTRMYGGAGLGLAICKRIVESMSGQIGLSSVPGQGSNFWFTLPYEEYREGQLRATR